MVSVLALALSSRHCSLTPLPCMSLHGTSHLAIRSHLLWVTQTAGGKRLKHKNPSQNLLAHAWDRKIIQFDKWGLFSPWGPRYKSKKSWNPKAWSPYMLLSLMNVVYSYVCNWSMPPHVELRLTRATVWRSHTPFVEFYQSRRAKAATNTLESAKKWWIQVVVTCHGTGCTTGLESPTITAYLCKSMIVFVLRQFYVFQINIAIAS